MGLDTEWEKKIISHPEWDKIRKELCGEYEAGLWQSQRVELAPGAYVFTGGYNGTEEAEKRSEIFSKLCWYINNGLGYCEDAPENLKILMRRLDIKV